MLLLIQSKLPNKIQNNLNFQSNYLLEKIQNAEKGVFLRNA